MHEFQCTPELLPARCGSKVEQSTPLPAHEVAPADVLEAYVTSKLRELIQQLGEAIHESVIESEQIAGVVQDIRRHGFDVLLMLEATIGLNEVATKETEDAEPGTEGGAEGAPFTKNDVNFLRSLRISVEGEDEEDDAAENDEAQAG
ncbi:MAG TPA: hypothetical protein VMR02_15995 [Terracidiphilus sp.]|jgi:uncharacterized protein (UPF0335 family)|nr:hypothetical protein [Terracidiphilus sp.]